MIQPYLPTITIQMIRAYVPGQEETYTTSMLVNAVAEILHTSRAREAQFIADCLSLDRRKLSHAIEIETGFNLKDLVVLYRLEEYRDYIQSHPEESNQELAEHLGFSSIHALWRFFQFHTGCTPDGSESKAPKVDNYKIMLRKIRDRHRNH